jgi:sugar lactone lactonase YvrE
MKWVWAVAITFALTGCASGLADKATPKILLDLDPASVDRTLIIESIAADRNGMLYVADRVSGNILRIDPRSPSAVVVARIEARDLQGPRVNADASGLAFDAQGDLYIAAGPFAEVLRVRSADLNPARPGLAQTWATGTPGANGIAFDRAGNLFVSGGASGTVFRVPATGGAAQTALQIERFVRTLPDGKTTQAIVANGLAFDAQGALHIADTARGALWKAAVGAHGTAAAPVMTVRNPLLEGADGIAFDGAGRLWVASNELNALVAVTPAGSVSLVARNGSAGPLEFPSAIVFVSGRAYVSNFDVARRDNLDASGTASRDGLGASVAVIPN